MGNNAPIEFTGPPEPGVARGFWAGVRTTLEMIKIEHSIFALPFALTGAMLAVRGWPSGRQLLWLIVAMVGARSAAMTFNRIADLKLDALKRQVVRYSERNAWH
jgi:4-hydroxybenzoate polyprenyltransferase